MDEILKLTLLYDFYGELLTEKQKQVFEMHYQNDLSLSEIGEELSISRQAVRDQLKRTEKILIQYEEKLRLVERFQEQQRAVRKMKSILDEIGTGEISLKTTQAITIMKQIADAILS
ncbi:YlxM family DNA-binding protein [Anaerotignum sp.]|uniref:YlxM family DNA-binding protein n=1 Tax=Anaerotignum sp. TaxID=2039241 RepID=UPI0033335B01